MLRVSGVPGPSPTPGHTPATTQHMMRTITVTPPRDHSPETRQNRDDTPTHESLRGDDKMKKRIHGVKLLLSVGTAATLAIGMLAAGQTAYAAGPPSVGLGTADSFAVLAGTGITNTGATTITGDVGSYANPAETGFGTVVLTGNNHAGDAVTQGAKSDLGTAYAVS